MMDVTPKGFRVLVEKIGRRKIGQIEIAATSEEPWLNRYVVRKLGEPGYLSSGSLIEINVQVGDEVMVDARGAAACGPPDLYGGRELFIVGVDSILGVMTGETDKKPEKLKPQQRLPALALPPGIVQ